MKRCIDCIHLLENQNYHYLTNENEPIYICTFESEFWEGDISAALEHEIDCPDYTSKEVNA